MKLFLSTLLYATFIHLTYAQNVELNYQECTECPQGMDSNPAVNDDLYDYENSTPYETEDIESDFDIRNATGNSRWHKGLDLRNHGRGAAMQRGDALISPEQGTISAFGATGYKYIIIDGATYDFGYGHIFSHNNVNNTSTWRSGNFVIKMDEGDATGNNRRSTIVNLNTCTAYSQFPNRTVIIPNNTHCNDTLTTTNQVALNAAFAPIGGSRSSATQDYPVHLHLYKFREPTLGISAANCMDPLVDIEHEETMYDLRLALNENIHTGNIVDWDSNNVEYQENAYNSIACRTEMIDAAMGADSSRYNNVAHDLDKFELRIRNQTQDNFTLIEGPNYESKIYIGARNETDIYPPVLSEAAHNYGSTTTTGINPSAYRDIPDRFRPWDDYYYSDFVTRIHQDDPMDGGDALIADCPDEARYPDGRYELYAEVTDVRDSSFYSDTLSFNLDNWKPYIKKVEIYIGNRVYEEEWMCGDSCVTFSNNDLNTTLDASELSSGMLVYVTTSEQIDDLTLSVPLFGISDRLESESYSQNDGIYHGFVIQNSEMDSSGIIALQFGGEDTNGNELISFSDADKDICKHIPHRTSDTTWLDPNGVDLTYGTDTLHSFYITCAAVDSIGGHDQHGERRSNSINGSIVYLESQDIAIDWEIIYPHDTICDDAWIDISLTNGYGAYHVEWYLDDQLITADQVSTSSWDGDEDLHQLENGIYTVLVYDAFCNTGTTTIDLTCLCTEFCDIVAEVGYATCGSGGSIYTTFECQDSSIMPIKYRWSSGAKTSDITGLSPGMYILTVTDSYFCDHIDSFLVEESVSSSNVTLLDRTHISSCIQEQDHGNLDCLGSLEISVNYGWDINWINIPNSNETSAPLVTDLCEGAYTVEVSKNNCTESYTYQICCCNDENTDICGEMNDLPLFTGDVVNVSNSTSADGSITLSAVDDVSSSLLFNWSGPNGYQDTGTKIENLTQGNYYVNISNGCISDTRLFIVGNQEYCDSIDIFIDSKITCILEPEITRGKIDLIVLPPDEYIYQWSNGITNEVLISFLPGTYTVTVTSPDGCAASATYELESTLSPLEVDVNLSVPTGCQTQMEILGEAIVTSGNPPYTYQWSTGSTESTSDMVVGHNIDYSVTITDACNFRFIHHDNYNCQDDDLCNDDCIKITKTGKSYCYDVCDKLIEFGCDKHIIECNCDDGVRRVVDGSDGIQVIFIGDKLENGDDRYEKDITMLDLPDHYYWITNTLTGCKKLVVKDWPEVDCDGTIVKILEWIIEEFGPYGNGSGNWSGSNDCDEDDWEYEYFGSQCLGSKYCPDTDTYLEVYVPFEICYDAITPEVNILHTYCSEDCEIIGTMTTEIDVDDLDYPPCTECNLSLTSCEMTIGFQDSEDDEVILFLRSEPENFVQLVLLDALDTFKIQSYHAKWYPDSLRVKEMKINISGALVLLEDQDGKEYIKYISPDNDFDYYYDTLLTTEIVEAITVDSLRGDGFYLHYVDSSTDKRYKRTYNYYGVVSDHEIQAGPAVERIYWSSPDSYVELYHTPTDNMLNCVGERNFMIANRIPRSYHVTYAHLMDDRLIVSGYFKGSIVIDGDMYTSSDFGTNYSSIVMVYDDLGNLIRTKTYDSIIYKTIYQNGIIYIAGYMIDSDYQNIPEDQVMDHAKDECGFIDAIEENDGNPPANRSEAIGQGNKYTVFPNPTSKELYVVCETLDGHSNQIVIKNAMGQTVLRRQVNSKETKLDIAGLAGGLHYLIIYDGDTIIHSQAISKF